MVSLPLAGRESVKRVKDDDLWAVDGVVKTVDESENCFCNIFVFIYTKCISHAKSSPRRKLFVGRNSCEIFEEFDRLRNFAQRRKQTIFGHGMTNIRDPLSPTPSRTN